MANGFDFDRILYLLTEAWGQSFAQGYPPEHRLVSCLIAVTQQRRPNRFSKHIASSTLAVIQGRSPPHLSNTIGISTPEANLIAGLVATRSLKRLKAYLQARTHVETHSYPFGHIGVFAACVQQSEALMEIMDHPSFESGTTCMELVNICSLAAEHNLLPVLRYLTSAKLPMLRHILRQSRNDNGRVDLSQHLLGQSCIIDQFDTGEDPVHALFVAMFLIAEQTDLFDAAGILLDALPPSLKLPWTQHQLRARIQHITRIYTPQATSDAALAYIRPAWSLCLRAGHPLATLDWLLCSACDSKHATDPLASIVALLLSLGANVNARVPYDHRWPAGTPRSSTPLQRAVRFRSPTNTPIPLIAQLTRAGADWSPVRRRAGPDLFLRLWRALADWPAAAATLALLAETPPRDLLACVHALREHANGGAGGQLSAEDVAVRDGERGIEEWDEHAGRALQKLAARVALLGPARVAEAQGDGSICAWLGA